jgi:hypothetical protein
VPLAGGLTRGTPSHRSCRIAFDIFLVKKDDCVPSTLVKFHNQTYKSTMSFGKGVISHVFEHGNETRKRALTEALVKSVGFGFGNPLSVLEDRIEAYPETAPVTSIEVASLHPRGLVGKVRDVEVNAALRALSGLPYWNWYNMECLEILKGQVALVRFVNREKPQAANGALGQCVTLDLDQVSYFLLRDVLDPTFKMEW